MRDTTEMAREAWLDTYGLGKDHISFVEALKRFEALVRADEREACAKVCDEWGAKNMTATSIAEEIRARGNT